jgi:ABC-type lipoprotein release transport system permease subunit
MTPPRSAYRFLPGLVTQSCRKDTTFGGVTIVVALTAAVSTAGPAWFASRVEPVVTLRGE